MELVTEFKILFGCFPVIYIFTSHIYCYRWNSSDCDYYFCVFHCSCLNVSLVSSVTVDSVLLLSISLEYPESLNMLNSFSDLATICLFLSYFPFILWMNIGPLYSCPLHLSNALFLALFLTPQAATHLLSSYSCLEETDSLAFYCFSSNVFYFPRLLCLFFFFVTCSWFVLNSANAFSKILTLSCLRSLVWLFRVVPFRISFLFVVLGYLLIYRKGMASVSTVTLELSIG